MPNIARVVEALVEPIGFLWLINLVGAVRWTLGRKWWPALFCWFVAGVMIAIGSTSLPSVLLASLERSYAAQQLQNVPVGDVVVMLGGVLCASEHDAFGFQFGDTADRVITAAELVRRGKAPTLVLGGGGGWRKTSADARYQESPLLENWLKTWGMNASNFVGLSACRSTRDEALQVRELAKERHWRRVILVTSAYHMRRAEAIFRQLDVPIVPVACDFVGTSAIQRQQPLNPVPTSEGFYHLDLFLHEMIGWYYYRLRGWVAGKSGG